jgi:hypothetical protein
VLKVHPTAVSEYVILLFLKSLVISRIQQTSAHHNHYLHEFPVRNSTSIEIELVFWIRRGNTDTLKEAKAFEMLMLLMFELMMQAGRKTWREFRKR